VTAVQTEAEIFPADAVVLATGAWSGLGLTGLAATPQIRPIRGQMLLFKLAPGVLDTILYRNGLYLIPRRDGHVLVGSTLEDAGFDKSTDGATRQRLHAEAAELLPAGYTTDLNGQSREFRNSSGSLAIVFVLSLLFIYLVLAAQFESFVDPFIIMLSVPLSMLGALLALKFTGGTLNVFSQIGLITLVGLITKHGILIVEFANQLREQGVDKLEAVKRSAALRLRPILMTTGAMVLGAIPLALATGAGAESRQQIGWVIVGGMSLGTLLTIFVVPTMYSLLSRAKSHKPAVPVVSVDEHAQAVPVK
jgi:multidrug efflux pump subunit AcrB